MQKLLVTALMTLVTSGSTTEDEKINDSMRVKYNKHLAEDKFNIVKAAIEEDMTGRVDYNYADMEELFFKKTQLSTCRQGDILPRGK